MGHFDDGPKKIVFEIIQARVYIFDAVPELKSLILREKERSWFGKKLLNKNTIGPQESKGFKGKKKKK